MTLPPVIADTPHPINLARVYDHDLPAGARLLVDRLWPRGVAKAELALDDWLKSVAPSDELRLWYHAHMDRWQEFAARYHAELDADLADVARCLDWCRKGPVTLLYASRERQHNNAAVLRDYLIAKLRDGG